MKECPFNKIDCNDKCALYDGTCAINTIAKAITTILEGKNPKPVINKPKFKKKK